jgi:16S rRNA (guanine527-N7)-methyltransferase
LSFEFLGVPKKGIIIFEIMELLLKYFPELTARQVEQFAALYPLYEEWNGRINVVSRKDFESLYLKHVLHSLAIARVCRFAEGARVLDIGTGGGFPAVPLAIMFPEARFTAIDSIGKKIRVVEEVARGAGIENVTAIWGRAEDVRQRFEYVVSRAVTDTPTLVKWCWGKIERGECGTLPAGMLLLKGGDLTSELTATGLPYKEFDISDFFTEEFFATKKVIYLPR